MLTNEQFDAFALEIATFGNIPISSRNCGIGCIYCKVQTDPILKKYPKIPDISLVELYRGFKYVNIKNNYIRLGAGVLVAPQTDPYLHPLIYEFIKHTAEFFPQKRVTTVSTGSYIKESMLDFLHAIPNFGIDLSLITMQEEREAIVPNATRDRINYLLRYAPLNKVTLMFTGDLDVLKRDLDLLYSLNLHSKAKEILVRRIEYTDFSQNRLNSIAYRSISKYEECVMYLKENHPNVIFTVPVLKEAFKGGSNEYFIQADERIALQKKRINKEINHHFDIICSESGYEYFTEAYKSYVNVKVHLIKNKLYGGSVTVAGLLNHKDIFSQFNIQSNKGLIVLPLEMYNHEKCDITGESIFEVEKKYNAEVWVM